MILSGFTGISVHDFWNPHPPYHCTQSFGCTHILRAHQGRRRKQELPEKVIDFLIQAKEIKEEYQSDAIPLPPVMSSSCNNAYDYYSIRVEKNREGFFYESDGDLHRMIDKHCV